MLLGVQVSLSSDFRRKAMKGTVWGMLCAGCGQQRAMGKGMVTALEALSRG